MILDLRFLKLCALLRRLCLMDLLKLESAVELEASRLRRRLWREGGGSGGRGETPVGPSIDDIRKKNLEFLALFTLSLQNLHCLSANLRFVYFLASLDEPPSPVWMSYVEDPFLPSFLQLFTISQEVPEVERGKRRRRRRLSSVSTSSGKFALTFLPSSFQSSPLSGRGRAL